MSPILARLAPVLVVVFVTAAPPAVPRAAPDGAAICDAAAAEAARRSGVPAPVLRTITRTETGRPGSSGGGLDPWPWTVNMEGIGKWFDDRAAAMAYVRAHHERGARSYDVGCFQTIS